MFGYVSTITVTITIRVTHLVRCALELTLLRWFIWSVLCPRVELLSLCTCGLNPFTWEDSVQMTSLFGNKSSDPFQRLTDWSPTGIGSWGDYSPWQSHLLQRIFAWGSRIYNQHFKLQQLFRLGPSDVMENQNLIWKQTSPRAFIVDYIHVPSESILSTSFWKSRKRVLPFFSSIKYLHNLICKFSCIEKRLLREERVDNYAAFSAPWPQSGLAGVIYYKSFAPKKDE